MEKLSSKNIALIFSIAAHLIIILIISLSFNSSTKRFKDKYVEVGFGGITESNSPGSPGGGIRVTKSREKVKPEIKRKEKIKERKEFVKDKKINSSPVAADTGKALSVNGGNNYTGNASSNGKPGNGGKGNGSNGSGPPKAGILINQDIYYVAVDQMPVPIGGMNNLNARVVRPPAASANKIHGTVYILAFINERGIVTKVSVLKGLGYGCDQSAINAIRQTRFEAGELKGVPVKVQLTIPIYF